MIARSLNEAGNSLFDESKERFHRAAYGAVRYGSSTGQEPWRSLALDAYGFRCEALSLWADARAIIISDE